MVRALKYFHFITPATLLALAAPTMAQTIAASSQCNGANLAILCDGNPDAKLGRVACERTSLQITTPKGDVLLFPKPREFADPKDSNTRPAFRAHRPPGGMGTILSFNMVASPGDANFVNGSTSTTWKARS